MKAFFKLCPLVIFFGSCVCGCKLMTAEEMGLRDVSDSIEVKKSVFGASFKVKTQKDTQHLLDLNKVTWNRKTGAFELNDLHSDYNGSASSVITAEVERMKYAAALAEMQVRYSDSQGNNIEKAIRAGGDAAGNVGRILTAPFVGASVSNSGPLGTTTVRTGTGLPPTTQPVSP